jgi:hypothetical protein
MYLTWNIISYKTIIKIQCLLRKTPWSESASELYQPSDRRLSAKLDRSRYFFFQVAPQLYSRD